MARLSSSVAPRWVATRKVPAFVLTSALPQSVPEHRDAYL